MTLRAPNLDLGARLAQELARANEAAARVTQAAAQAATQGPPASTPPAGTNAAQNPLPNAPR